jgi:hypothetical protein
LRPSHRGEHDEKEVSRVHGPEARRVHDYSKLFNHLVQYALDQVDTNEKRKTRFMNSLSTKLQERMALNIGGSFPEFISNIIIANDAIHTHKDNKTRKVVAAPSGSAPPKYQMVYHPPCLTYQPHQHQHQQWASCSHQRPH